MRKRVNIIVTLAGHSRRFQEAGHKISKAFIETGKKRMIERVVAMFSQDDKFYFVINEKQQVDFPDIIEYLSSLRKLSEVIVIPPHEKGPTHSALQVKNIPNDEEVIITYCDFTVEWNYEQFLRLAQGHDAAVPTFKGFHPASFGHTYYAYIRNEENNFLELREKKSFTDTRQNEHASAGIYYFNKFETFKKYGTELLLKGDDTLPEAYVSLLYNSMKKDGLSIVIYEVDKFICLGTPEDLEQFNFWWKYFNTRSEHAQIEYNQINLIPMAGKGNRFIKEGYRLTKPLIKIGNETMVMKASHSFPKTKDWVFLVQKEEVNKHPIAKELAKIAENTEVFSVDGLTSGQAATCLLAEGKLDKNKHLFIASCDYATIYSEEKWKEIVADKSIDGAVWTCRLQSGLIKNPNAFAYCRVGKDGKTILQVHEKEVISDSPHKDPLVVGSFWYRNSLDFVYGAKKMISDGITVNNEHYVGTSINSLIKEGKRFVIFDIDQWISFGDPFELKVYEYWEDYFFKIKELRV